MERELNTELLTDDSLNTENWTSACTRGGGSVGNEISVTRAARVILVVRRSYR